MPDEQRRDPLVPRRRPLEIRNRHVLVDAVCGVAADGTLDGARESDR